MAKPPSYPEEVPVGDPVGKSDPSLVEARDDTKPEGTRTRKIVTGAAIGIGSAALVAALLYANRSRKSGRQQGGREPEKSGSVDSNER